MRTVLQWEFGSVILLTFGGGSCVFNVLHGNSPRPAVDQLFTHPPIQIVQGNQFHATETGYLDNMTFPGQRKPSSSNQERSTP